MAACERFCWQARTGPPAAPLPRRPTSTLPPPRGPVGGTQRIINRPLGTEAAKCRWRKVDRLALRGGTSGTGDVAGDNRWRVEVVPGAARSNGALPHRSLFDVFNFPVSSSGSAPRTSSSRRRAPFGAARRPSGSPIPSGPPACPPGTSAATRPPAARTPPTWSSAARRRRCGAALCRPALLDGAAQPP